MFLYWLTRFFVKALAKIFFRLQTDGRENLPLRGGFILAANHASSLDPFMISAAVGRYIRWTVIHEYYELWYLRWILRRLRFIRVKNNLPKEILRALWQGEVIGIFPEGRRSYDGKLGPAKPGAAALARRTSHPVVPVGIIGTFTALPRTRKYPQPYPVIVRIGRPLFFSASENKQDNERIDQENTARIMAAISGLMRKSAHP